MFVQIGSLMQMEQQGQDYTDAPGSARVLLSALEI